MFSSRAPSDLGPNRLARAIAARRARGARILDLTESNPTRAGFAHPPEVFAAFGAPDSARYDPEPFGLLDARLAVAGEVSRSGVTIDPARIVLTASSSEAYSHLLKLLCDPGDEVLVPTPSYPLFDHLARLDGVRPAPYATEFHGAWSIDVAAIARAVTRRTRAVFVVSPNNPTGAYVKRHELAAIATLCREQSLALVGDEVFYDYPLEGTDPPRASVLEQAETLTFGLGGLSKSAALPQMKLGWMAMAGPPALVDAALARLELIADTYLSVSTPVQRGAGALIAAGARMRPRVQQRLGANLASLRRLAAAHPACTILPVEGGWSAVVQVPATRREEELVLELLERDGVLVHPGYFFDFAREAYLVVSLLAPPAEFEEGAALMLSRAAMEVS